MADWLIFLFKIGGFGAVLVFALIVMAKWLLKQTTAAFNSYVTAYAQETAKIDARIRHLEQLAEEQARLTRTVESIKDEIAAQAKSRDNRWAFRKDVYVNLITASTDLLAVLSQKPGLQRMRISGRQLAEDAAALLAKQEESNSAKLADATSRFLLYANLSPLATADNVKALIENVKHQIAKPVDYGGPNFESQISEKLDIVQSLIQRLWVAGRKDLWDTAETADWNRMEGTEETEKTLSLEIFT
jgi:cell division protein FtsB